jgi:hypothetical protein
MAGEPDIGEDGAQAQRRAAEGTSGSAVKTSELHIAVDRHAYLAGLEPKVWLESSLLRTWVIAEPSLIVDLLRSRHAAILNVDDMIGAIERAYGGEFPNVRFAALHLPLFLEGKIHAERRKSSSLYLAGRMADLAGRLPVLIERHLRPLRSKGTVELMSEVTGPLVREITSIFIERPVTDEIAALNLLDLFALNKSLRRFEDLDLRVKKAREFLAAKNEGEELLGCRFSALTMGFETLLAMLTEGLHLAFRHQPGDAGDHIQLPAFPIETGVPISYRKALVDFDMAGHAFRAGDLFRLQLQTLGYSGREQDHKWIFGAGTHSCVGKQVSLRIWTSLKRAFDALAVRGRVRSYDVVPSHYMVRHNSIHIEVF